MKKWLILLFVFFLWGCKPKVEVIKEASELDRLLEQRQEGKYKEAVVYDLRHGKDCYIGHIAGFTCIFYGNSDSLEDVLSRIKQVYKKNALVIFICEDGVTSLRAAKYLVEAGYRSVHIFEAGYRGYVDQTIDFVPEVGCNC